MRIAISIVLLAHSVPSILSGGVNDFGRNYLDEVGFAPFGLILAWAIKLSHVVCAFLFFANRYVRVAGWITMAIMVMGIIMVHGPEGWFVVGGGRNGAEFNVLIIFVLLAIMYPNGFFPKQK